jgi:hypothetical protein
MTSSAPRELRHHVLSKPTKPFVINAAKTKCDDDGYLIAPNGSLSRTSDIAARRHAASWRPNHQKCRATTTTGRVAAR